jgi:hypothetical protein
MANTAHTTQALHAIMLCGRAPRCRIELHDVVFAVGDTLESMHEQILEQWFGTPGRVHVDAYARLDQVDGHRIELKEQPYAGERQLYFVNIGGYLPNELAEQHAYGFLVAANKAEAKRRAKTSLLPGRQEKHKDDLYEVDDCLVLIQIAGRHIHLIEDANAGEPTVINGYFPLPPTTVKAWLKSRKA